MINPILAVIPARGGSKGLPGKNIRPLAGLPLIVHSIRCAKLCKNLDRIIVSSDSPEIIEVAKKHGADVPFVRPKELAQDTTPMMPVLQHALREIEKQEGRQYGALLLLDPTSPGRLPQDISEAVIKLEQDTNADGVIGVSIPEFNPYWHCVVENKGYMAPLIAGAGNYTRRQDLPIVYRINASLYLWRRNFLLGLAGGTESWMDGRMRLQVVPESRSIHIDDLEEFKRAELIIRENIVHFPWMVP